MSCRLVRSLAAIPVQVQVPAGAPGGGRYPPCCNADPAQERAPSSGPATESAEDCSPEGSRRHLMDDTIDPAGPSTPHHVWSSEFCPGHSGPSSSPSLSAPHVSCLRIRLRQSFTHGAHSLEGHISFCHLWQMKLLCRSLR